MAGIGGTRIVTSSPNRVKREDPGAVRDYFVHKEGFIDRHFRKIGDVIPMTPRDAKFLLISGQVGEEPQAASVEPAQRQARRRRTASD